MRSQSNGCPKPMQSRAIQMKFDKKIIWVYIGSDIIYIFSHYWCEISINISVGYVQFVECDYISFKPVFIVCFDEP